MADKEAYWDNGPVFVTAGMIGRRKVMVGEIDPGFTGEKTWVWAKIREVGGVEKWLRYSCTENAFAPDGGYGARFLKDVRITLFGHEWAVSVDQTQGT